MRNLVLTATPCQLKNIATLLGYLRQQLTARNTKYDHGHIGSCTVGFAITSRLFPALNRYTIIDGGWGSSVVHSNSKKHAVVSESVLTQLFGKDYLDYIVFVDRAVNNPFNPYRSTATASLRYVIKNIAKLYGMDESASVNPTTSAIAAEAHSLRAEIEKRVAGLEEVVKACGVVYAHAPLSVVNSLMKESETELLILKSVLR